MKRSVLMLTILAFGIGTVLGSVTKGPNTAPYGQKLIKKVESCSLLQVPDNHGPSPIIMPSSRDAHFTFIDSSTNGYGMILGVTRPLVVTENDEWFFVFRQWYGEPTPQNNKSGQIGAAYSENGEDWDVYTYLNTGFNWPPSDRQGRYPSALGNEDYPFAFWNEYTSLGSQYGGRPYYTYDEFGWGGGSFADPIEVDPLYDDTKDLWVGSPGYSYDIDNDIHHFNVSYNDWSRNNYYLFHSEVYEDGYIIFGQEILIIDEQNDLVPGTSSGSFNSSTALSMTKDGYGMVGLVGLFAVDQYGNDCDPNNDGDCYHTAIFKLTEDHGATWHGDGGIYYPNYYHIPDNVWDHLLDNACLDQYWDPCLSTYTDLIDLWSWYELDMKVDSEGNPHIVLEVMPCDADGSCYYRNGDGTHIGSGFYHFTIDRDYIDEPGDINTPRGWNYSFVISGKDTWAFQAPDGDSFIWQTQASIAISAEDDNVVYVVTDMAAPGDVKGYDPQDPYDCEEPWEYYPYWSEDIYVLRSQDDGSTWSDSMNVTNTPDDGEECDPPTMSGWCSPEETFPHAAQWATNDKVYFVYQMPNWYHNTAGDLLALDHVNRLYAGWVEVGGASTEPSINVIPADYSLENAFPNPFNPLTKIQFDVPEANDVNLVIYDMLGREVNTLVSGFHNRGTYSVVWNGKNNVGRAVPSGVYFYRMASGEFSKVKKLVLLK